MGNSATSGRAADPEFRRERAKRGAAKRHSLDTYVASIVRRAPELTAEQIDRLRSLLPPAAATPDEAG